MAEATSGAVSVLRGEAQTVAKAAASLLVRPWTSVKGTPQRPKHFYRWKKQSIETVGGLLVRRSVLMPTQTRATSDDPFQLGHRR